MKKTAQIWLGLMLTVAGVGTVWAQQSHLGWGPKSHLSVLGEVQLPNPTRSVDVYSLGVLKGAPGEDLTHFLKVSGAKMATWSARSGFEACAQICRSQKGKWGLYVTTNQSHLVCTVVAKCPEGLDALVDQKTIHTHPKQTSPTYVVNKVDKKFILSERKLGEVVPMGDGEEFSPEDMSSVSGYLVTGKGLLRYWSKDTGIVEYGSVSVHDQGKIAGL